jgi:hypothetical protein
MKNKICRNCYFLTKCFRDISAKKLEKFINILSLEERKKCKNKDFNFMKKDRGEFLECSHLVWSEGSPGYESPDYNNLINQLNRKDECFYFKYRAGMLLPAAKELEKRKSDLYQLRKDRRLTEIGLIISGSALALNLIWELIKYFCLR